MTPALLLWKFLMLSLCKCNSEKCLSPKEWLLIKPSLAPKVKSWNMRDFHGFPRMTYLLSYWVAIASFNFTALKLYLENVQSTSKSTLITSAWSSRIKQSIIADVAVTKCHQRWDEIRIIFTRTSPKSCFQENCHAIYTPFTLKCNPVRTAHACTLDINTHLSHSIRLIEMCTFPKNNFADSSIVRVKMIKISSCCLWRFFTATSAINSRSSLRFYRMCSIIPIFS